MVAVAPPTWSGTSGRLPISSDCRRARRRHPSIISWIATAIATTSTAAKISDPTSVPEFMPDSFHSEP
jgi:hypothetical protein